MIHTASDTFANKKSAYDSLVERLIRKARANLYLQQPLWVTSPVHLVEVWRNKEGVTALIENPKGFVERVNTKYLF